jgi:phenylpropionate dioxygenase-like ring-hydroxylating dioxygenase large terminal subunit
MTHGISEHVDQGARRPPVEVGELIASDRVHGSLYTDPDIYDLEVERIWSRGWVYVGHLSEIREPGDYVRKPMGPQPLIMTRDKQGQVHLLLNRCTHRANIICDAAHGNAGAFRCPYHGWTFANDGRLLGFPFSSGYRGTTTKQELGLGRVPRVEHIHGFVFGSFAEDGPTLREYLGPATEVFDRLVGLSPAGEVELTAGWLKHRVHANWKMVLENETDGYHPQFVHASIFQAAGNRIGDLYSDHSAAVCRDLGNGHTENDLRPQFRQIGQPLRWFGATPERLPDYVSAMRTAHGEAANAILIDGSPHAMIFPNLFIAEIQVIVIEPRSVGETVQHITALQFRDAPDLNERMLSQTVGSFGPAGMLLADDVEMYERNFRGVHARAPEWLLLRRGTQRERPDERGLTIADATDELPQRAIWRHYQAIMETP